jgi:hypothetical protein
MGQLFSVSVSEHVIGMISIDFTSGFMFLFVVNFHFSVVSWHVFLIFHTSSADKLFYAHDDRG